MQSAPQAKPQGQIQTMIHMVRAIRSYRYESALKFYPPKLWITLLITSPRKGKYDAMPQLAKQCLKNRQNRNIQ